MHTIEFSTELCNPEIYPVTLPKGAFTTDTQPAILKILGTPTRKCFSGILLLLKSEVFDCKLVR